MLSNRARNTHHGIFTAQPKDQQSKASAGRLSRPASKEEVEALSPSAARSRVISLPSATKAFIAANRRWMTPEAWLRTFECI